jgi:hypothetical protein
MSLHAKPQTVLLEEVYFGVVIRLDRPFDHPKQGCRMKNHTKRIAQVPVLEISQSFAQMLSKTGSQNHYRGLVIDPRPARFNRHLSLPFHVVTFYVR